MEAAAARATLVEMMADVDDEVGELFLMEEEVSTRVGTEPSATRPPLTVGLLLKLCITLGPSEGKCFSP